MRRRLLSSTLLVAVTAVVLLGLPLAIVGARAERSDARQRLERDAVAVAAAAEDRIEHGLAVDSPRLRRLVPSDRYVVVDYRDRADETFGPHLSGPLLHASAPFDDGVVRVTASASPVDARVLHDELFVAGLAALAIAVAVGLAILQSRRLGEPLVDLAATAGRLGAGDTRPAGRRYGIPELDRVAEVLDASAARVSELLRHEREFASDASHQLRTPLTALSIRLEEIAGAADQPQVVAEEAAAALAQAERLSAVVRSLLVRARHSRAGPVTSVDVGDALRAQQLEWEPAYRRAGRRLVVKVTRGPRVRATVGSLGQVVATLLENALVHGAGTVTVTTRVTGPHVVVEVADEGPGVPPDLVPHVFERAVSGRGSTGLGLALARALVEADGGRLELAHANPAVFAVFLPVERAEDQTPTRSRSAESASATG